MIGYLRIQIYLLGTSLVMIVPSALGFNKTETFWPLMVADAVCSMILDALLISEKFILIVSLGIRGLTSECDSVSCFSCQSESLSEYA